MDVSILFVLYQIILLMLFWAGAWAVEDVCRWAREKFPNYPEVEAAFRVYIINKFKYKM